jgi:uroporphyrinogen decarboxylase
MTKQTDGIYGLLPRDEQCESARRLRDFYAGKSGAPLIQEEFGFYVLDRWKAEGHMPVFAEPAAESAWLAQTFGFEPSGRCYLGGLGWCEAAFEPAFPVLVLETQGDHELVQDHAGRKVLYFKNRRNGFMPEYQDHPVKDRETWLRDVAWRLDPGSDQRYGTDYTMRMDQAVSAARSGKVIVQNLIGGYMYLRSLFGPLELLYLFYDDPDLIHACMQAWLDLADAVITRHQTQVTIDELFLAEDICYNHGPLIAPVMMRQFLFPYYQQLISNIRKRQLDQNRTLHIQIDTDGYAVPTIDVYREIGMDYMSPFEVASGCDVVAVGRDYPWLLLRGGIDKRVLAEGPEAIDRMLDRILPVMHRRGGYIPVCDHGVPEEVSFANYAHYRRRLQEYGR